GAIVRRPVVDADDDGESIAIRSMGFMPMTYDHRLIDGADAGRFLTTVKDRLTNAEVGGDLGLYPGPAPARRVSRLYAGTPAVVVSRTGLVWYHVAQRSVTAPRSGRAGDPPTRHGRLRTHLGSPAHPRRGTRGRHPGGHGPAPRAPGHV